MISGVILKVLSDLGFYLSIAGLIGALFGAPGALIFSGWFVLTAAGFLAWLLRNRGFWRFAPFLPAAAYFFFARYQIAEAAVFLPAFAYVVYLAAVRRFEPNQDVERQIFSVFWKLLIVVTLFCLIAKVGQYISDVALPIGLVTMLCQILLIRGLRHEEEVRSRPSYQLTELLLLAVIGAVILFLGSETGVRLLGALLKGIYNIVLYPVLMLLVRIAVFLLTGVAKVGKYVWEWIVEMFNLRKQQHVEVEIPPYAELDFKLYVGEGQSVTTPRKVIVALICVGVAVMLFFIFRYMSRRARDKREDSDGIVDDRTVEKPVEIAVPARERGAVAHVRAAYRRYLRLGAAQGVRRLRSDTTLEIQRRFSGLFPGEEAGALRELYLRARYDGHADKEDAARAKELLAQMKKNEP
jgi:hypothetical protein